MKKFSISSGREDLTQPFMILFLSLIAIFLLAPLGAGLGYWAAKLAGLADPGALLVAAQHAVTTIEFSLVERNGLRWLNLVSHLFTFIIPPFLVLGFLFRRQMLAALGLAKWPTLTQLGWGLLFFVALFPLVQFIFWFNQQLPLPEWMLRMENRQDQLIAGLLQMDTIVELLFTLLVVAVVPAVGEELVFRGLLQRQLARWWAQPVLAIWLSGFIFSAIHLQFAGFLPRLMLGAGLGYLLYWSGSLWLPIACHLIFNGGQVLLKYFFGEAVVDLDPSTAEMPPIAVVLPSLLVAAMAAWQLIKKMPAQTSPPAD